MNVLTNMTQVRQVASEQDNANYSVRLAGIVLWISPERDRFILQDDFGGAVIKMDLRNSPNLQPGQKVLLEGNCLISRGEIVSSALIDNDGIHSAFEKTGTVFLSAGIHPIIVEWFNGPTDYALELDWKEPGKSRQRIPDAVLFRMENDSAGGTNRLVSGLSYRDYEGDWNYLPDFSQLSALRQGTVSNFDLSVCSRDTNVALVFSGYFNAPQAGEYQFWLKSDDGANLYIGQLQLKILGEAKWPAPQVIFPGEYVSPEQEYKWSQVEGTVTRINDVYGGALIELSSGAGRAYLKVINGSYNSFSPLLQCRIRADGINQNASTIDGQTVPCLLVPVSKNIAIMEMASTQWPDNPVQPIGSLSNTNFSNEDGMIVHVSGILNSNQGEPFPEIKDNTGGILFETAQSSLPMGDKIEAVGWLGHEDDKLILRGGFYQKNSPRPDDGTNNLPLLTKAIQVKSLSRKEAQRGYPVKIQGVITAKVGPDFVIQDSTWSVFGYWRILGADRVPEIGDYWEIEGVSDVQFAPDVIVRSATYLRPGILPEPIRPNQDELNNGSLDTQYIEVQGIATAIETNAVTLLTRGGKVRMQFYGSAPKLPDGIEDALIRVRGVGSPNRDTNQMIAQTSSPLRLFNASVNIDEPPPLQPFAIPLKRVSDLLFFDARADALRRIKVAGQILHERQGEYFLSDNGNGLRFFPKSPASLTNLETGDRVEVVGFPDMSGTSPVLHEALVRKIGKSDLPPPRPLSENTMVNGKLDSTLVSLRSRLVSLNVDRIEQTLELQTGTRSYIARLANKRGMLSDVQPGSLLELTGVYAGQGGGQATSRNIDSFELLLNSPGDVHVLERPSWWTFQHTLSVIGGMVLVIVAAMVWIALLHRQVEERSLQLTAEIKGREQAERQRALEEERARIAQDLHDELGATLTEIRFLGAVKSRDSLVPPATRKQLMEVSEKSRQMVSSLDEIVWAVNPANDSLPSLASYLRHVAEEFFRTAGMRCRLDVDQFLPPVALTSEVRHNLYLIVREALNNIVKHAKASEAWLRIHWKDSVLHIVIEDNGCGFVAENSLSRNGLQNMRHRIEKIGGQLEFDTRPGAGTTCRVYLRLV
ncbi:MAG TPA: ATP-binding protein [Verrucomicrobiae bacterium]|nr:ATP-binding protein [Verrucomicrobiae bacterium]